MKEVHENKKAVIQFKDVVRTYGEGEAVQYAVNHVDFTIYEGEFAVILGQSGAGKSTVLNMLGGMDQPTTGQVVIDGEDVSAMNERQLSDFRAAKIGFIFQFYNLIPSLTAYENVALTKSIVKDAKDAKTALEEVGLTAHRDKFPAQLSGGEQQRVSIARALAKNPRIILGVVLVTHNADIAKCADKIIRMKNGKIVEITTNEKPLSVEEVAW